MKIIGIDGLDQNQIETELQRGGRFVIYQYCISVVLMTFKRSSDIYFIKGGESSLGKGIGYSLISMGLGWWGLPWGPIYTVGTLFTNMKGGRDITPEVFENLLVRE